MARSYKRDSRGRFSGGTGGTLAARGSLGRSRAKQVAAPSSAQKGAVTRGSRKLAKVKTEARRKIATAKPSGTISQRKRTKPVLNAANAIKPSYGIGTLAKAQPRGARSKVVPTGKLKRPEGLKSKVQKVKGMVRRLDRSTTRDVLQGNNLSREIARQSGGFSVARTTVQRRQQRAFAVANGRNPRIGSKALYVYQGQLGKIGKPSNQRVGFRRKPMTAKQSASAAAARDAASSKRFGAAIKADTKASMAKRAAAKAKPTPKPKAKRKRKP
jgi:hypothetical protein